MESANIGKAAPKPDFLDEAEQGDGRLKEEGEAQSGESDEDDDDEVHQQEKSLFDNSSTSYMLPSRESLHSYA